MASETITAEGQPFSKVVDEQTWGADHPYPLFSPPTVAGEHFPLPPPAAAEISVAPLARPKNPIPSVTGVPLAYHDIATYALEPMAGRLARENPPIIVDFGDPLHEYNRFQLDP